MGKPFGLPKRTVACGDARVQIESRVQWRAWLESNHLRGSGVRVVTFKRHRGDKHVPYEDAIDEALCFGWIDSLPRKLDDAPVWSAVCFLVDRRFRRQGITPGLPRAGVDYARSGGTSHTRDEVFIG